MRWRVWILSFSITLLFAGAGLSWNNTGHEVVAGIAWDNMTPAARHKAIALLEAAPPDACLRDLFPHDARPLAARQREFFMRAATWPDRVRPDKTINDTRPCTRFHRGDWHFFDRFWQGVSGETGSDAPKDRPDVKVAAVNAVERLHLFRPLVACGTAACGTPLDERATTLAWILHLVGDIHQPLHTSSRMIVVDGKEQPDQGGNLFKLSHEEKPPSLHGFWDGILDASIPRQAQETDIAYFDRVIGIITHDHPRATMTAHLHSGDFDEWSREGFATTKNVAYPKSLKEGEMPDAAYRQMVFKVADEAIALAGYRLADVLNKMLQ